MTLGFDLQIPGLPELLQDVDGIDELVLDEATRTMRRSVDVLESAVVQYTPVNSGALRGAWGTDIERGNSAVKGTVANPLPYALNVEKGRRPGAKMPPVGPIYLWAYRKGIVTGPGQKSRSIAFAIARSIAKKGIKGAFMAEKGLELARPIIEQDFAGIPDRVAARFETS